MRMQRNHCQHVVSHIVPLSRLHLHAPTQGALDTLAAWAGRARHGMWLLAFCAVAGGGQALAASAVQSTQPTQSTLSTLPAPLQRFDVQGNSLLDQATLAAALGDVRALQTLADMQAAAQRLQDAYRAAGYGAVVVALPEQNLQNGVLRLQVVEGKLKQINITGQNRYSRDNILRSLSALQLGQTPALDRLDQQLRLANENPGKSANVVFQPGFKQGEVDALVTVNERSLRPWLFSLDNTGASGTGHARASLRYQQPNVADRDIVWGLRATTSPSQPNHVASVGSSLRVPLYQQNMMFEANLLASNTESDGNLTPAGELRFSGSGASLGGRTIWLLPSLAEYKSQLALGVDVREYRNKCSLGVWGAAGCGPTANNRLRALPLTLSYSLYKPGSNYFSANWINNLGWGRAGRDADYNNNRPGASASYQLLRLNAQWQFLPSENWRINWRTTAQLTPDGLVPAEQFGLGGMYSVRGYRERELMGDYGIDSSVELSTPLYQLFSPASEDGDGADTVDVDAASLAIAADPPSALWPRLGIFLDAGRVANRLGTFCQPGRNSTHCSIWSAGLGLNWSWQQRAAIRLDAARAGKQLDDTQRGDWRAHLSFSYAW